MRGRRSTRVSGDELTTLPARNTSAARRVTGVPRSPQASAARGPGQGNRAVCPAATALSPPEPPREPVEQLDRAVEIIDHLARTLPVTIPDREELVALAGVLTQLSRALHTLTDRLIDPLHRDDRAGTPCPGAEAAPNPCCHAATQLLECRTSYASASTSARALHAALKHWREHPLSPSLTEMRREHGIRGVQAEDN